MTPLAPQFVTDDRGQRTGVLLGIDEYHVLLDALEELDAIRAYDGAKASGDAAVPFEDAVREIERGGAAG